MNFFEHIENEKIKMKYFILNTTANFAKRIGSYHTNKFFNKE